MTDETKPKQDITEKPSQTAEIVILSAEEKRELLEKVSAKLEGTMIAMTEDEIEDFFDTRGF